MLEAAKALEKGRPGPASARRLADDYGDRMRELAAKGLYREEEALLPLRDRLAGRELLGAERRVAFQPLLRCGQAEAAAERLKGWSAPAEELDPLRSDL